MTHIKKEVNKSNFNLFDSTKTHPFIFENKEDLLIFDIETTGLSHQYAKVVLIGYMFIKNGQIFIEQLFAETLEEEIDILNKFYDVTQSFSYLVSYNGNSFDIPFLNSRYAYNQLDKRFDKSMNIDLLRVARKLSKKLSLCDYKLKTVEEFLGIYRKDTISGKESVDLYNQYIESPNKSLKSTILLHNFEDILYLGKVVDLLYYQSENDYSSIPQLFMHNNNAYYISTFKRSKDFLIITLFSRNNVENRIHFSPGQLSLEQKNQLIEIKIPMFTLTVEDSDHLFVDIDLISDGSMLFNELSYEDKIKCHVDDNQLNTHLSNFYLINLIYKKSRLILCL